MAAGISAGVAFIDILPNMAMFSARVGAGMRKMGTQMMSYGARLSRILTVPILAVGAASVKMGLDFERKMTLIKSQAGASTRELERMKKAVLDLAPKVGTGPDELAEGMFHVESVGYRGAKALKVLKTAAMGAKVGMADVGDTASALAGVVLTNIRGTGNLSHAMGVLNGIIGAGNMHMQDLNEAIKSGIVPTAKTAGLSLQSLGAALAMMTDEGIPAGVAANRLRTALFMLTNPTEKAQKVLKSIGLTSLSMGHALQGPNGLNEAMKLLRDHLSGVQDPAKRLAMIGQMFGGSRSAGTIALLLNNLGRIDMKYKQITGSAQKYNQAVNATRNTSQFKLDQAWAAIQADLVRLSVQLIPIVLDLAGKFTSLSEAFGHLSMGAQKWIVYGALIAASAGPIVFAFGSLLTLVGGLATGFSFLGLGIVRVIGLMPGLTVSMAEGEGAMIAFGASEAVALAPLTLIAVGIAGVAAAAYVLWEAFHQGSGVTDMMGKALDRARDSVLGLNKAFSDGRKAHHDTIEAEHERTAALHSVTAAQRNVNKLEKDGKKGTLEYKQAVDNLNMAKDEAYAATGRLQAAKHRELEADRARVKAVQRDKDATTNLFINYHKQEKALDKLIRTQYKGRASQSGYLLRQKQEAKNLDDVRKGLADLAKAHEHNAEVQQRAGNGAMAATERHLAAQARAAIEVSKQINGIPTFKQIEIQMAINAQVAIQQQVSKTFQGGPLGHDQGGGQVPVEPPHRHKHAHRGSAGGGHIDGTRLVGEFGPELFTPDGAGMITPNRDLSAMRGSGRMRFVVENWDEMTGYVEQISDSSVTRAGHHKQRLERMRR